MACSLADSHNKTAAIRELKNDRSSQHHPHSAIDSILQQAFTSVFSKSTITSPLKIASA
jgi:hypothetical protein